MNDTPRTDAAYAASTGAGIYELFKESQDIERELNAANQIAKKYEDRYFAALARIKRLEEAGDRMADVLTWSAAIQYKRSPTVAAWRKAKEDKL